MGLEARIWALRLGCGPQDWDLGLETGIWASRLGFEGGREGGGEGENPPYVWKHRSSTPLGPLPKKRKRKEEEETEEVTQSYNIVADRWAGAYKSMPHPLPHTHNRITLNAHFYTFQLYHHRPTDQCTCRLMDQQTDQSSY